MKAWLPLGLLLLACRSEQKSEPARAASSAAPQLEAPTLSTAGSPPFAQLETAFDDADFRIQVDKLRTCVTEAPFLPPAQHKRVAVTIDVTGKGERVVPVGPLGFSLEDADGHRYGATLAGCGPNFSNQNLTRAQRVVAEVAFDVPEEASELRLVYEPFLIGRPKVAAFLALPR